MTGFKIIDYIRQCDSQAPVVIITASNTPEIFEEAMKRGAAGVLFKPFLPSDILRLVDSLLTVRGGPDIPQ
jgi:CheY-like chemotaxis protein